MDTRMEAKAKQLGLGMNPDKDLAAIVMMGSMPALLERVEQVARPGMERALLDLVSSVAAETASAARAQVRDGLGRTGHNAYLAEVRALLGTFLEKAIASDVLAVHQLPPTSPSVAGRGGDATTSCSTEAILQQALAQRAHADAMMYA